MDRWTDIVKSWSGSDLDLRAEYFGVTQVSAQAHGGVGYNIKKTKTNKKQWIKL